MSDPEDDYMSNDFLSRIPDVKPGITESRTHKRHLKVLANSDRAHRQLPRHELEIQRRHESLNQPVPETNKGFGLLAKMGYVPGMPIGKNVESDRMSTRITEPIEIKLKNNRAGLGHEKMEQEQQHERCEAYMNMMRTQAKMSDVLAVDYRKRKRNDESLRIIISDIVKSRKACQELDLRCKIETPTSPHLWPVMQIKNEAELADEPTSSTKRFKSEDQIEWKYVYCNGAEALPENLDELGESVLISRLTHVTNYLREEHFYCVWCGTNYEDSDELDAHCPGPSRDLHD